MGNEVGQLNKPFHCPGWFFPANLALSFVRAQVLFIVWTSPFTDIIPSNVGAHAWCTKILYCSRNGTTKKSRIEETIFGNVSAVKSLYEAPME